jgi:orotate phosphoribosyltransferase
MTEKDVLGLKEREVFLLKPGDLGGREMTSAEFAHIARLLNAFWMHDGNPESPHALLTKGKHSNGFINCGIPLSYANLCAIMAGELLKRIRKMYTGPIDWVVGSDHAGAALACNIAGLIEGPTRFDFCEKGAGGTQLWKRHQIAENARVLHVEELMTTAGTASTVRRGIREGNEAPVLFIPLVAVLVHRSIEVEVESHPVIHAFHFDIENWAPEDCPLCKQGSEAIRPKGNWERLVG